MTTTTEKTPAKIMDADTPEVREGWHRHPNGGGWVEDTATVAPEAWVGMFGVACGNCWVGPKARIWGGVISGGEIRGGVIRGGVIWGGKVKESPLQIQGTRDFVTETPGGNIQIGCIELTLADWREKGAAIARTEGFTSAQVEEYRAYLDLFERLRPALSAPAEDAEVADVR